MTRHLRLLGLVLVAGSVVVGAQSTRSSPNLAEPGISPDGREIAFASGGDIWTVPSSGGEARLLVSHGATESRPIYSPQGNAIAFVSTRTGGGDIYVLRFDSGSLTRLTFDDGPEVLDGWSRDGQSIFFSSTTKDIAGMNDILVIPAAGGTPMPASAERYTNEFFSQSSPDGRMLAFSARGIASGQWWRNGRSHIDESEIWIKAGQLGQAGQEQAGAGAYRRVVGIGAKALWPMWADDSTIYYVSDRSGSENIWKTAVSGAADQAKAVTTFSRGRVLWPTMSANGKTIAFERDFGIWTLDTASGQSKQVPVQLRGAAAGPQTERLRLTNQFSELALSPDGKKVAFVARGDVFAASAKDGGDAERVTSTPGREADVVWTPDSRKVLFTAERDGSTTIAMFDFGSRSETMLSSGANEDRSPVVSPDGTEAAFIRGRNELRAINLATKQERLIASADVPSSLDASRSVVWSPDGKWIAYMARGVRSFSNVRLVPSAGGESRPVSFLSNLGGDSLSWAPDGTFLTFATGQRTEDGQVARVDLILRTPKFREDQFRSLFEQDTPARPRPQPTTPAPAAPAAPPPAPGTAPGTAPGAPENRTAPNAPSAPAAPIAPVFDDIRRRLSLLPIGLDVLEQQISPDGKWVVVTAEAAGQNNLYVYSIDELSREPAVARQLTSTSGPKASAQFSPDSKEVFYLDEGRIQVATVEDRRTRALSVTAELDVDFLRERQAVLTQAWTYMRDYFFDEKYNGADWAAAKTTYGGRVMESRTPDEMRRVISLMLGELNASHLGITAPPGGNAPTTGRLGVRFDAAEYAKTGALRITEILPLGPLALTKDAKVGDYLVAVDGRAIDRSTNLDELLLHTIGKRVVLSLSTAASGGSVRELPVRPANLTTEKGLLYRDWVEQSRALVARLSNGRLGYAHMPDMSEQSLNQLFVDLDADNYAKEGVVVDVRNNNGGFVNVYAIDVLARRSYFDMTPRGASRTPSRSILGQRALERPTVLVTNQHSLSDAEDFTEGYRSLGLGKVVGEPTAGWIIYTWNTRLVDGSTFRLPRMRITARDGSNMELHPRPVDVAVTRPIGEAQAGRDSQLEAAVKELLAAIDKRSTQN